MPSTLITRRGMLLAVPSAWAARVEYPDYSRRLPDYLAELARDARHRRERAIQSLTSRAAVAARQRWVRDTFWRLAGGVPARTPLEQRTLGSFERKAYRVERIVYQSRPGFDITANLYVPTEGKPPYPGVLFQMGHSLNGKAAETYQRCCQGLVRLGNIVLAFDPMGQGERTYYPKAGGTLTRLPSADDEHTLPGWQMLLSGDTATRLQVWDAVRSLDVLAAHPLVDPARLASTGQSGGGTLTMLLAAVDDRLAAAAVSCGNTENFACANFNPPGSTDDAEQNLIGSGPLGFDRWDLLYPLAPKPLLLMASARDFFGTYSPRYLASGRSEFARLKRVYTVLGVPGYVDWVETPTPHALSPFLRGQIYAWFERWLHGRNGNLIEEETQPERDAALWVGASGNAVRDFGGKSPLTLARERAASLHPPPLDSGRLERLLALSPRPRAAATVLGRVSSGPCQILAIDVASSPAWLFAPRVPDPAQPVLLVAEPRGRTARWAEGALYHQLASKGIPVLAVDLRGIGDLTPELSRGNPHYALSHSSEESWAWAALILGKPLVGQRVNDLLAFAAALSTLEATRNRRIVLAASGHLAVPALFAAALEARIATTYLAGGLVSYASILDFEEYRHTVANFLPGVLEVADLPTVAVLAAPRRIVLAGAVDGAAARLAPKRVRERYAAARNVEVLPEARWDLETLAAL